MIQIIIQIRMNPHLLVFFTYIKLFKRTGRTETHSTLRFLELNSYHRASWTLTNKTSEASRNFAFCCKNLSVNTEIENFFVNRLMFCGVGLSTRL